MSNNKDNKKDLSNQKNNNDKSKEINSIDRFIDRNKNKATNKNKLFSNKLILKFAGTSIAAVAIGSLIGWGMAKHSYDHNINGNVITAKYNDKHYHLTARKAFDYLIKSSNNQQALLNLALNQVLLKKYPNNNYQAEARQKLNKVIQQVGGQAAFNTYMAQHNTNEQQYLMSMANIMIIKDQLQKNYKPTNAEIENAYKAMGDKYNLSGVNISPQNANSKKSIIAANDIAKELNNKDFNAKDALKKKSSQYLIIGAGINSNIELSNINSNNNSNLPSTILNQLKNKKVGDIIISNAPYSHYIVKIDKVIHKGTLAQEKTNIIKQLKQSASTDSNKQLHFSAELLKETGFKSNSKDIQEMITLTKQK